MFKIILVALALIVIVLVIVIAMQPAEFRVARGCYSRGSGTCGICAGERFS
jgi:preprotein translocase subunit SecG